MRIEEFSPQPEPNLFALPPYVIRKRRKAEFVRFTRYNHHKNTESGMIRREKAMGGTMASVFDVAAYILKKTGPITTMKLEKLCYYSQAWSLVWDETPLFPERIEAWANGPVCPNLYHQHKGRFRIDRNDLGVGDPGKLTDSECETVDAVLDFYGRMGAYQLSELTHHERPWLAARGDLAPGAPGSTEITIDSMAEYYESLTD